MNLGKKAAAAVMAGLMAVSAVAPASIALAEQNQPSVGAQTGSGVTDLTMVVENTSERGGTDQPQIIENPNFDPDQPVSPTNPQFIENPYYNPDQNNDSLGDNIAFTVPSAINYVVKADGSLVGPAQRVTYVENESVFGIEVSSVDVDEKDGFKIVSDASTALADNVVDLQFGPTNDMLQASEYLNKKAVNEPTAWRMDAAQPNPILPLPSPSTPRDRVTIASGGHAANITADITNRTKFGQIRWYVQPSEALPTYSTSTADGTTFNTAIKQLAANNQGTIQRIVTAKGTPDTTNGVLVSHDSYSVTEEFPIYATFDAQTGTLTLTSKADKILISESAASMFKNLPDLTYVDGRNFVFQPLLIQNFSSAFEGCTSLETIEGIENWFTDDNYSGAFDNMFKNCNNLTADCSHWNVAIPYDDNTTATTFNTGANGVIAPNWGEYVPMY